MGPNSASAVHLMTEAMKRAFWIARTISAIPTS